MLEFRNKNVLVTGGSRGIGFATALGFAKLGANVAITYRSNDDAAEIAIDRLQACGVQARKLRAESVDEAAHTEFVSSIISEWGTLDCVVANAGIWKEASIDAMSIEDFREMMEINMTGTFVISKQASLQMKRQRSGSIVVIASTAGQRGESEHSHYAASKGAQISFTKSLATELAPYGIRVNAVAPGWVRTEMTSAALHSVGDAIRSQIPLGRPGEPEEIANAVLFLSSDLASFITGEIFNVNGGAVLCG